MEHCLYFWRSPCQKNGKAYKKLSKQSKVTKRPVFVVTGKSLCCKAQTSLADCSTFLKL